MCVISKLNEGELVKTVRFWVMLSCGVAYQKHISATTQKRRNFSFSPSARHFRFQFMWFYSLLPRSEPQYKFFLYSSHFFVRLFPKELKNKKNKKRIVTSSWLSVFIYHFFRGFGGGGEGSRTPVRKPIHTNFSGCRMLFKIPGSGGQHSNCPFRYFPVTAAVRKKLPPVVHR